MLEIILNQMLNMGSGGRGDPLAVPIRVDPSETDETSKPSSFPRVYSLGFLSDLAERLSISKQKQTQTKL